MYQTAYHTKDIREYSFLITGGAGFIGSHIAEYLLKHNSKKVRVLDNLATGHYENIAGFVDNDGLEFIDGDIMDFDVCAGACEGIDFIFHEAALGSVQRSIKDPIATNSVNVDGFLNILMAGHAAGVKRIVYASSSSVYGDDESLPKVEYKVGKPLSPYAVTKKTNELYAQVYPELYNIPILGLRYFNVFGPRQDPDGPYAAVIPIFINNSINGEPVHIDGDGTQTRDFTFVENAVQANIKSLFVDSDLLAEDRVFNVAVEKNYSITELFEMIKKILGSENEAIHEEPRVGDIKNSLANLELSRKVLGYEPTISLEEGLKSTVEFYQNKMVQESGSTENK
ncbi:MAG: SDR family oxidoreductase [Bacteroidetes bacterium]|nr:SDR family oxidoreductase [Bacteroidota bacterium]